MFLEGIGIAGYRSFGPEMQRIGPFNKINLIIGPNNSGKSNFLRFLRYHYPNIAQSKALKLEPLDRHIGDTQADFKYEIGLRIDGKLYQELMVKLVQSQQGFQQVIDKVRQILTSDFFTQGDSLIWLPSKLLNISQNIDKNIDKNIVQELREKKILTDGEWRDIWAKITGRGGGGALDHWIPETIKRLLGGLFISPGILGSEVSLIPAIREIVKGNGDSNDELMSGKGIVKQLAKLEKPRHDQQHLKRQFEKINHFLQTVTGNQTARIEIPSEQDIIQVEVDGCMLPLSSLGTGIHEVIILASAATILENQIVCIEEPEIHLHPLLQKLLLRYLAENTTNQYFIATHSAHILDVPHVSIFRIRLEDGKSIVDLALTDLEKSTICDELGYKASDLLQSNCIVWVEGPSDRIYLNHWIHAKDDSLIEGIHYSIMFYGGRLLSHLSADDEEVQDFIALKRLNRHLGIVIDSDKKSADDEINGTKKRIEAEFKKDSDFVWVTQGKEIENYLKPELIGTALNSIYAQDIKIRQYAEYSNCIEYHKKDESKFKTADKVKVANQIANMDADFNVLDLNERVDALVCYIHKANSLE